MSESYYIAVNGKPIQFTDDEIEIVSSRDGRGLWNVFYNACKREFNYIVDIEPDFLKKNGVEHLSNIVKKNDIDDLKNAWETSFTPLFIDRNGDSIEVTDKLNKNTYSVRSFLIDGKKISIVNKIISQVLTLSLTKKIEAFYESHFSINHVLFTEAFPDPEPLTSFRWHTDGGPDSQLHIMIYLDGYEETGGRTEFINYADTKSAKEAGYNSDTPADRTTNIKKFLLNADIIAPEPEAGDILIFNAPQVLHQGIHPTRKSRKVMTLIIQPDFRPWPHSVLSTEIFSTPLGKLLLVSNPLFPYYVPADS